MTNRPKSGIVCSRLTHSLVILTLGAMVGETVATLLIVHFIR